MPPGFRSPLPPLGLSVPVPTVTPGVRSLLAFWAGGASVPVGTTVARGAGRPRPAREPWDETDDEEVLTLVVSALMYYANTR